MDYASVNQIGHWDINTSDWESKPGLLSHGSLVCREMRQIRLALVEDDACIAAAIMEILKQWQDLDVQQFEYAEEAYQAIFIHPPDLLILNVRLAGKMNGIELADRIRTRLSIPMILITGEMRPSLPAAFLQMPELNLLPKPFLPFQLVQAIDKMLS
ncbi:MAG: response regulator [Bacteroidia bacterium]